MISDDFCETYPIASQTWSDEQRRAVWCLIAKSRRNLQLEISPIIASAFVILQHYFKNQGNENPYDMFILMVAALFTACKAGDCYRPMELIYQELAKILKMAPNSIVRNIQQNSCSIDERTQADDMIQITNAEIDLLHSVNFETNLELPFQYFEKWRQNLMLMVPNQSFMEICTKIIIDICLVICSKFYLDLPPEVAAAAATADTLPENLLTKELAEWFADVREKYGKNVLDLANKALAEEKNRTARRRQQPARRKVRLIDEDSD